MCTFITLGAYDTAKTLPWRRGMNDLMGRQDLCGNTVGVGALASSWVILDTVSGIINVRAIVNVLKVFKWLFLFGNSIIIGGSPDLTPFGLNITEYESTLNLFDR